MTLVQPEGSPAINRSSVSVETALRSRRACGASLTAPTEHVSVRDATAWVRGAATRGCQGRLIRTPATAATPPTGAHAAPGADLRRPTHGKGTVSRGVVRSGLVDVNPPDKFRHRAICERSLRLVSAASIPANYVEPTGSRLVLRDAQTDGTG